jgi:selenocysteine-specific elongation factor
VAGAAAARPETSPASPPATRHAAAFAGEPIQVRPDTVRVGSADRELAGADQAALTRLETLLRDAGASPPLSSEMQAQLGLGARFPGFVGLLEEKGAVVKVGDALLYHRQALDALEAKLRAHLATHDLMSMGDFKELTGLSRKYAVPLLEHFDRRGVTARVGDNRRAGPLLRDRR